jgi:hypothetical protein
MTAGVLEEAIRVGQISGQARVGAFPWIDAPDGAGCILDDDLADFSIRSRFHAAGPFFAEPLATNKVPSEAARAP